MELRMIDATLAVAAQMQPEDLAGLAAQGFAAVICNRPDGEEPGQPPLDEMRRAAQEAGLAFHHIPVAGGQFPPAAVAAFADIFPHLAHAPGPPALSQLDLQGERDDGSRYAAPLAMSRALALLVVAWHVQVMAQL